ncbi:hypothetical protein BJY52DRAFT_1296305 [Lactarius psammicola]|nr:hypothetical protein BJY52DRAFT_1296305 [Lactarius psammicola]
MVRSKTLASGAFSHAPYKSAAACLPHAVLGPNNRLTRTSRASLIRFAFHTFHLWEKLTKSPRAPRAYTHTHAPSPEAPTPSLHHYSPHRAVVTFEYSHARVEPAYTQHTYTVTRPPTGVPPRIDHEHERWCASRSRLSTPATLLSRTGAGDLWGSSGSGRRWRRRLG